MSSNEPLNSLHASLATAHHKPRGVQALPDCRAGQHLCNGVLKFTGGERYVLRNKFKRHILDAEKKLRQLEDQAGKTSEALLQCSHVTRPCSLAYTPRTRRFVHLKCHSILLAPERKSPHCALLDGESLVEFPPAEFFLSCSPWYRLFPPACARPANLWVRGCRQPRNGLLQACCPKQRVRAPLRMRGSPGTQFCNISWKKTSRWCSSGNRQPRQVSEPRQMEQSSWLDVMFSSWKYPSPHVTVVLRGSEPKSRREHRREDFQVPSGLVNFHRKEMLDWRES